ncbi:MAG: methyltransferase domain-containing protein [Planctomycetota bacterium]
MTTHDTVLDSVKEYYGKRLQGQKDLKTDACCTTASVPPHLRPLLAKVHPEVAARYYGCGLVAPDLLDGCTVLDLGCGTGHDCFVLSALVGERGSVVGVDMTDEQIAFAERHVEHNRVQHGHARPNVRFVKGYIERLDELGLADQAFDVIVSNCVINLSPDKPAVLREAFRLLKPGGELFFADVYADRRVPAALTEDPELYGECLSGALYWNDFLHLARGAGFADPRLVTDRRLSIDNAAIAAKVGPLEFFSATYRLIKLPTLEPACEDHGQAVVYRGTIPHRAAQFALDAHHVFDTGRAVPVCGNTFRMLAETRFRPHFDFVGDFSRHFGVFPGCGTTMPFASAREGEVGGRDAAGCC